MGQGDEVRGLWGPWGPTATRLYCYWLMAMVIGYVDMSYMNIDYGYGYSQLVMGFDIDNWLWMWVLAIGYGYMAMMIIDYMDRVKFGLSRFGVKTSIMWF